MDIIDEALLHRQLFPCSKCQLKSCSVFDRLKCCSLMSWKLDMCEYGYKCGDCDKLKKPNRQIPIK